MKNPWQKMLLLGILVSMALASCSKPETQPYDNAVQPTFTIQYSLFVGSAPWDYAAHSGILERRSKQFGVKIKLEQVDSAELLKNFAGGESAGCVATNMEVMGLAGE